MSRIARTVRIVLPCLLALAAAWPMPRSAVRAQSADLLVVVSAAMRLTNIDRGTLRRVFSGYATEVDGQRLIPVNHPLGTATRAAFDRIVLGLSEAEVGRYWIDRRIRDEGQPPRTAPSAELSVRLAASLPGIITYTTASLLTPKLRALTIDGKAAGDRDYPLTMR